MITNDLVDKGQVDCLRLLNLAAETISRFDAEIMLAYLLGVDRAELYINETKISTEISGRFLYFVRERAAGRPLQHITGRAGFMGMDFMVSPAVLIPRPETELLVEETIRVAKCIKRPVILDLGTGSGNIAISLTKFITDCKIMASDVSEAALSVARGNAKFNLVEDKKIDFILSDLFENLAGLEFDIIVSNPPYVFSDDILALQKEISFEPRVALDGGRDGLYFYRSIIEGARGNLKNGGYLILEIGYNQAEAVEALLKEAYFTNINFIKDYNYIKRIVSAKWIN